MNQQMSKCEIFSLSDTCAFLKSHDNYLILTHCSPDGDTLGSGFALMRILEQLGKKAAVLAPDGIPDDFIFLEKKASEYEVNTIVAVDIADDKLLGTARAEYGNQVDLCIDHHGSNIKYSKALYVDSDAAATCEIIFELAVSLGTIIDKSIAEAIYTGVATDTGCFKYSNTTDKTHFIAAKLFSVGINASEINRVMFETKTRAAIEMEKRALSSLEFYFEGKCALIAITGKMLEETGCAKSDLESITAIPRTIEGVLVGVTLKETEEGKVKVSVRTHSPIDAAAICKNLGGGGHMRAAGCQIKGTVADAKKQLLEFIKEALI
ncbi:MAG: bifunctional oligoribonuclease/PAP phosphatase NrnA [Oscillospiraceae bacterium]